MSREVIAKEVLGIPEFGDGARERDQELLQERFPRGMAYEEVERALIEIKRQHLYCTEVYFPKLGLRIFHYPDPNRQLVVEDLMFLFEFDADQKLKSCSYYTGAMTIQAAEPGATDNPDDAQRLREDY